MTSELNERMQFLLDCLTADKVRPKDRFKYIKTKEFKAKCKVYKYRISERDIKTLYKLNCFSPLQPETELEVTTEAAAINTANPIITTYRVITQTHPPLSSETDPEAPLIDTYKVNGDTAKSAPQKSIEFFPNVYTLCAIYLTIIATVLYTIYVVFVNDFK